MKDITITIDWLGGNCPVQAEGQINGKAFYFRARGESWSLEIHPYANCDFLDWPHDAATWVHEEDWGAAPCEAGWMPQDVARALIEKAAKLYLRERA